MFGLLCRNANALSRGTARCLLKDTKAARDQILWNFRSWRSKRPEYLTHEEWDAQVVEVTGDFIENFETRTCGKAVGDARLGSSIDLAIATCLEDVRVVVVCTDKIFRHSSRLSLKRVFMKLFSQEKLRSCELFVRYCQTATSTSELCM